MFRRPKRDLSTLIRSIFGIGIGWALFGRCKLPFNSKPRQTSTTSSRTYSRFPETTSTVVIQLTNLCDFATLLRPDGLAIVYNNCSVWNWNHWMMMMIRSLNKLIIQANRKLDWESTSVVLQCRGIFHQNMTKPPADGGFSFPNQYLMKHRRSAWSTTVDEYN